MTIAIAGLGTVGAEVARQIINHKTASNRAGFALKLAAVSARDASRNRGVDLSGAVFESDPSRLAVRDDVDIVVELIGGEDGAALELIETAIKNGKSVVTANKALLAKHGARLAALAEERGVSLAGEAAVAGGIPILKMLREGLAANRINRISGILNGTCNYILSVMEASGRDFDDVLKEAQDLGYAEADPSFDIDGIDAAHKLALLAAIAYGSQPDFASIRITGIRKINALDISAAADIGYAIRLLATADNKDGEVISAVQPAMVPLQSGLAKVGGALNAVLVESDPLGAVMATGPGAGAGATASAVLADIIDVATKRAAPFFGRPAASLAAPTPHDSDHRGRYYLRLTVYDRPGVLADVTAILRDHNLSVEKIIQQGRGDNKDIVPVIITTHMVAGRAMASALRDIENLDVVTTQPTAIMIHEDA